MSAFLEDLVSIFISGCMDFFDEYMVVQNILFAVYIVSTLLIFLVFIQIFISGLNQDIWKAKRILALYPGHQISKNIDNFRKVLQTLT